MFYVLINWDRDKMAVSLQTKFKRTFFNENMWILIKLSLKFIP